MAEDDPKDKAKDSPDTKKTPVAEAARARTETARSAAEKPQPETKSDPGPETKSLPSSGAAGSDAKTAADSSPRDAETKPGGEAGAADDAGPFKLPQSTGALAVVFVIVIVVLILIAWPGGRSFVAGLLSGSDGAGQAGLAQRLGAVEETVARMDKEIATLRTQGEAQAALDKRVTALEARPAVEGTGQELDAARNAIAELSSTVKGLEARIAKLESATDGTTTMTLMALASALRTGAPFAPLAARAQSASGVGPLVETALQGLAPFAEAGVPTLPTLMARLETLKLAAPEGAAEKPAPEAAGPPPSGFWEKVVANVKKLGRVRKGSDTPPAVDFADARAATAEALVRGDLIAAAEVAKSLPGEDAANWRRDLEARIKASQAALAIDRVIAGRLGQAQGQR